MRERAAIVTGGGTGIGRAAALALHRDGYNIVIAGRRPDPLEGTRELAGDGCVVHPGDIREREVAEALVERCLQEFGRIDCLVNNAGGQFVAPAEDITPNGWRAVRPSQPRRPVAAHAARREAVDDRARRRPGDLGRPVPRRGIEGMAHSSAARAGMGALTNTLSLEWGKYGIGLVCVAPGWIDTEGVRGYGEDLADVADRVPMKRIGTRRGGGRGHRLSGLAGRRVHHRARPSSSTAASRTPSREQPRRRVGPLVT